MTDTTDTSALREFLMEQIDHADSYGGKVWLCAEDARLAMSSLDQLEAERQQRETADRSAAAERLLRKASDKAFNEQLERAEAAEKEREGLQKALVIYGDEILELRAKLANPVVLSDCSFEAVSHMAHWYSEGECVAWVSGAEHVKKQILEAGFTVKGE